MATINSNDLRQGMVFYENDTPYLVIKYSHMKKGRGQATIRVKVKNLESEAIRELTYTNEQKVEAADVEKKTVQYLYSDEKNAYFMNNDDYSQFQINKENVGDELEFLKEGQKVIVMFLEGNPIAIELPKVVELEIKETSEAVSGNTVSGAMKDAVLETGSTIQVPLFIKTGEKIKVNTESKSYVSRV
ncbi:elongation factor P [Candidatus Dojkabacteria bacterium]|nr:elongation factor P [Candidatus Dojkabacteria bacterium]